MQQLTKRHQQLLMKRMRARKPTVAVARLYAKSGKSPWQYFVLEATEFGPMNGRHRDCHLLGVEMSWGQIHKRKYSLAFLQSLANPNGRVLWDVHFRPKPIDQLVPITERAQ